MQYTAEVVQNRNLRAGKIVRVYNKGDRPVTEMFNGQVYSFPPRSYASVTADRAWLWFGDPDLRENHTDWQEELVRLQARVGADQWAYRLAGNFYCKEFGDPQAFYAVPEVTSQTAVVATPIDDLEAMDDGIAQAPDPTVLGAPGLSHLTEQVRTAPRKRQV